jgi:hypothetical protein
MVLFGTVILFFYPKSLKIIKGPQKSAEKIKNLQNSSKIPKNL